MDHSLKNKLYIWIASLKTEEWRTFVKNNKKYHVYIKAAWYMYGDNFYGSMDLVDFYDLVIFIDHMIL